ncbi:MAG: response regulator [Desulfocucumaceae bacterium]
MLQTNPQKKVIIIDHSLFMRTTIKILLASKGCDTYEADEETKAVTITVNKKPNYILMSMGFAKQNKMKFVKTLKKLHKCPIIIYANVLTKEDVLQIFKSTADDVLLKPLQQGERLNSYFVLTPADIRKFYLTDAKRQKEMEFNSKNGWAPLEVIPVREGGQMKWNRKAV